MKNGKRNWYVVDGYLPYPNPVESSNFQGHEAIMILNCNEIDANIVLDVYYEEKAPVKDISITVRAERVLCLRMDKPEDIGGITLNRQEQYSIRISSDVNVVVQYGRMDITQPNLAYIGTIGYGE